MKKSKFIFVLLADKRILLRAILVMWALLGFVVACSAGSDTGVDAAPGAEAVEELDGPAFVLFYTDN